MGKISDQSKYPLDGSISGTERFLGTDPDSGNATRQYLLSDLVAYFKTQLPGLKSPSDSKYDGFIILSGSGNTDTTSVEAGDIMIGGNPVFTNGDFMIIRVLVSDPDPVEDQTDYDILLNLM